MAGPSLRPRVERHYAFSTPNDGSEDENEDEMLFPKSRSKGYPRKSSAGSSLPATKWIEEVPENISRIVDASKRSLQPFSL